MKKQPARIARYAVRTFPRKYDAANNTPFYAPYFPWVRVIPNRLGFGLFGQRYAQRTLRLMVAVLAESGAIVPAKQTYTNTLSQMSPTVFRESGFRFYCFSREEPRMHVHVQSQNAEPKLWLEPTRTCPARRVFPARHQRSTSLGSGTRK